MTAGGIGGNDADDLLRPRPGVLGHLYDRDGFTQTGPTVCYNTYNINNAGNISSGTNHGRISQDASSPLGTDSPQGQTRPNIYMQWFSLWALLSIFVPTRHHANEESQPETTPMDCRSTTLSDTAGSECEVISMDDSAQLPSVSSGRPYYEVYVRALLTHGHGLPCWEPKPSDPSAQPRGVVPGDVGTYTTDAGFKRMFNLWESESTIREIARLHCRGAEHRELRGQVNMNAEWMRKGEVISCGASTETPFKRLSEVPLVDVLYEFRCRAESGAILAMPTPADKEETDDLVSMSEFVRVYAEAIYRHACTMRPLGEKESLYIVTGCIKSDSWAIAAHQEYMHPDDNTLQLASVLKDGDIIPEYKWTKQGLSRARCWRGEHGVKDQSLFLRGLKLAFSSRFRSRIRGGGRESDELNAQGPSDAGPKNDRDAPSDPDGRPHSSDQAGRSPGQGALGRNIQSGSNRVASPDGAVELVSHPCDPREIECKPFPDISDTPCHPSDVINAYILQETGCDVAMCHDDSWCSFMKGVATSLANTGATAGPENSPGHTDDSGERCIFIQNGVAFLLPQGSGRVDPTRCHVHGLADRRKHEGLVHLIGINGEPSGLLTQTNPETLDKAKSTQLYSKPSQVALSRRVGMQFARVAPRNFQRTNDVGNFIRAGVSTAGCRWRRVARAIMPTAAAEPHLRIVGYPLAGRGARHCVDARACRTGFQQSIGQPPLDPVGTWCNAKLFATKGGIRAGIQNMINALPYNVGFTHANVLNITDPLGETRTLSWSAAPSYNDLHRLLVNHFRGCLPVERAGGPGGGKSTRSIIEEREELVMSMLIEQVLTEELKKLCPNCGKTRLGTYEDKGWRVCRRCNARFIVPRTPELSYWPGDQGKIDEGAFFRRVREVQGSDKCQNAPMQSPNKLQILSWQSSPHLEVNSLALSDNYLHVPQISR